MHCDTVAGRRFDALPRSRPVNRDSSFLQGNKRIIKLETELQGIPRVLKSLIPMTHVQAPEPLVCWSARANNGVCDPVSFAPHNAVTTLAGARRPIG